MKNRAAKAPESSSAGGSPSKNLTGSISHARIAEEAGVSPGLVSAFFSGNHYSPNRPRGIGISAATRQRIKETCLRLNYVPDNPAGFFRLYPEKADVGFLLNENVRDGFSNPYHSLIIEGFAKLAFEQNVDLNNLFFRQEHDYMLSPEALPNAIQRGAIKKVALMGLPPNYSLLLRLKQLDVATVVLGLDPDLDGMVSIVPDYFEAGRTAIHELYRNGHRRIAVFAAYHSSRHRYNGKLLAHGCVSAAKELGVPLNEEDVVEVDLSSKSRMAPEEMFKSLNPRPTGVFCFDDQMARVLISTLAEAGIRTPDDVSVIGCNDDRYNQELPTRHSTIHVPCREMGMRAFQELTRIAVDGPPKKRETILMPVTYVDRGTVKDCSTVSS